MSIASQITRLQNIKTAIRNALVNKGVSGASTHDMDDFATDIASIPSGGTYQSKTVSPSTSSQTVVPDTGYDALSSVTVNAAPKQSKSVSPSTSSQTVTPDNGYYGLSSVTVNAASKQSKSVTPTTSSQTVTPDSGYYGLSQVTVGAVNAQVKTTRLTGGNSITWNKGSNALWNVYPDSGYNYVSKMELSVGAIVACSATVRQCDSVSVSAGSTVSIGTMQQGVDPLGWTVIVAKMPSGSTDPTVTWTQRSGDGYTSPTSWTDSGYKYWTQSISAMFGLTFKNNSSNTITVFWLVGGVGPTPTKV